MFERDLEKLKKLKNKIVLMRDSKEKTLLVRDYYGILTYLKYLNVTADASIYNLDTEDDYKYDKIYNKELNFLVDTIFCNTKIFERTFDRLIREYHKYNFYATNCSTSIYINNKDMGVILNSFFYDLGIDVYELFVKMLDEGRIIRKTDIDATGVTIDTTHSNLGYILLSSEDNDLDNYLIIVHEMGHMYEMYLQRHNPSFTMINLTCEVISTTFEKLFYYFLENNNLYSNEVIDSKKIRHYSILNHLAASKIISKLHNEGNKVIVDADDLSVKYLVDKDKILNSLENDCGYVYKRCKDLNLYSIIYSINEMISTYFFYLILSDFDKGMAELKKFIFDKFNLDFRDLYDKYMIDLTKDFAYIKDFMEDYEEKVLKKK